jgi:hypothetical protein
MTLEDLLAELGVPTAPSGHHHVGDRWVGIDCPNCSPHSGRFRLGIPKDTKGGGNCWVCGPVRVPVALAETTGKPISRITALWRDYLGAIRDSPHPGRENAPESRIERKNTILPGGIGPLLRPHRDYLRSRGFKPGEIARLWGVRGIGIADRLPWRLFIPVREGTETVSWTTRSISDKGGTPYLTARPEEEKVHIRDTLYGAENARHAVIVCEGPLDAWAVGPGGVATCGVGYSPAQVRLLSGYAVRVVVFDAEVDAQRRAASLVNLLQVFDGDTFLVTLETGKDASRAKKSEIRKLRRRFLE